MSVNEEFLRELCENYAADWEFINQTTHPDDTQEAKEEAERSFQAILQHFQQKDLNPTKSCSLEQEQETTEVRVEGISCRCLYSSNSHSLSCPKIIKRPKLKTYTQEEVDRLIREAKEGLLNKMLEDANNVPHELFYKKNMDWSNIKAFILNYYDELPKQQVKEEESV